MEDVVLVLLDDDGPIVVVVLDVGVSKLLISVGDAVVDDNTGDVTGVDTGVLPSLGGVVLPLSLVQPHTVWIC